MANLYVISVCSFVKTYGVRFEPISDALLIATLLLGPEMIDYPIIEEKIELFEELKPNEIVNGLNISCGTNAFININGISVSAIVQSVNVSNGISIGGIKYVDNRRKVKSEGNYLGIY